MDVAKEITIIGDDPVLDTLKDMDRFLLRVLKKPAGDTNIPSSIGGNIYKAAEELLDILQNIAKPGLRNGTAPIDAKRRDRLAKYLSDWWGYSERAVKPIFPRLALQVDVIDLQ